MMETENTTRWVSDADVRLVAKLHKIPSCHYHALEQAMNEAAFAATQAKFYFQLNCERLHLTKSGKEFGKFVGALRKAEELLKVEDVRARLRYAGAVSAQGEIVESRYERLLKGKEAQGNGFEAFIGGDALARQLLDRLLRLASAGEGSAKDGKVSAVEDSVIAAAAALIPFWHSVLGRSISFGDWNDSPDEYLAFADNVLSAFMPGENFVRYLRYRKSKVISHLKASGLSNLADKAIC